MHTSYGMIEPTKVVRVWGIMSMGNVPVATNGHASVGRNVGNTPSAPGAPRQGGGSGRKKDKLVAAIIGAVVLVILLVGAWFLYRSSTANHIDGSKYQAVFLSNGQVYFGDLEKLNVSYLKLTGIFYLQDQGAAEAASEDAQNPQESADKQTSGVQLVKLGNEVHGPDDEMIIKEDQVLFFENLKKDGKVSQSIEQYRKENQ
jgi:hypothetical protein